MSVSDLACSYACLILHDDGIPITAEKIVQLVKAANVEIESYWPGLFASLAAKRNIEDIIVNMGSVGGGACAAAAVSAPAAGAGAAANAPPAQEKKKEEPQEESDEDMGFSLFD
ncbi:60S acidic ribosomal protein P1-like [Mangifera indica]|uniref:60S acidic ribosomal protein P1-like n=1 Tax=Mangifera indica TaxID=29780 RepID=UPI001CF937F5|nr:60S acidic ribosomal protein P1-like [Mangifera indica]